MAAGSGTKKGEKVGEPTVEEGLTPAPDGANAGPTTPGTDAGVDTPPAEAPVDRQYVILVSAAGDDDTWMELGTISAGTRPEAWEAAKAKWPGTLLPPTPTAPDDKHPPVLAKVVPARNFITIESTVEYQAPRAVAKGI